MKRPQNGGKAWINGEVDADFSQRSNYSSSWFPDVACWSVPRSPTAGVFPLFSTQNHHSLYLFNQMCFNNCFVFQSFTTSKVSFIGFLQLYLFQPLLQLFFAIEGFFQTFHYIFQPLQVCLNHSQPLKYHSLDLFNRVKAITASANPRAAAMFIWRPCTTAPRWTPPSAGAACKEQVEKCYCLPISDTMALQIEPKSPPAPCRWAPQPPWVQIWAPTLNKKKQRRGVNKELYFIVSFK